MDFQTFNRIDSSGFTVDAPSTPKVDASDFPVPELTPPSPDGQKNSSTPSSPESPPPPTLQQPPPSTPEQDQAPPAPCNPASPPPASPPPTTPNSSPPPPASPSGGGSSPPSDASSPPPPVASNNIPVTPSPGVFSPPPSRSAPGAPGRPLPSRRNPPGSSSDTPPARNSPPSSESSSSNNAVLISGLVLAGLVLVAVIAICLICSRKKKKQRYYMDPGRPPKSNDPYYNWKAQNTMDHVVKLPPQGGMMGTPGPGWSVPPQNTSSEFSSGFSGNNQLPASPNMGFGGFNQSQFGYEQLAAATSGFSQANLLGQGGFGYVHKGILPDGRIVAVKSLKTGSGQGEREFQAEVDIISRVHHRHLVSLVGYCIADGQRMLVYEFVPNQTLEFHLHGKGQPVMRWDIRLRIALGSAKGLAYLHEDCHPRIIHRDIKAANILLDNNFEAMVADFGLAKLSSDNYTHVSTRVMGTFGYLAPEYASSGKLTEKSDVFSFGVMLLELITGKRPVDPSDRFMEDSLVDWARPIMSKAQEDGDYREIADPKLEGNYAAHEMARMVACASASIRHSAKRRPKMSQIVRALEGDSSLDDLNDGPPKPRQAGGGSGGSGSGSGSETQVYDTGMYNADMTKFRKMVMNSEEFNSSDFGATNEFGLNASSPAPSTESTSREYGSSSGPQNQKPGPGQ